MYGKQIQTGLLWRSWAPTAQSFLGLETAGGSKFCSPVEEGLGDVSRTTGQGDGRNESRTQAPHSQLYRIPVLFHKVAAPHLSPRVGRTVVRPRTEAELLKIHSHIKERKVQAGTFLSCVTFGGKIIPSHHNRAKLPGASAYLTGLRRRIKTTA